MFEPDLTLDTLAVVGLAFVLAGFVKGVVGGGLPAIAVPIMAGTLEPALAAALTFVPVIATNIWLISQGGLFARIIKRYWPFLGLLAIGSGLGSQILVSVSPTIMTIVIGTLVILLSPLPFIPRNWAIPEKTQRWLNPPTGLALGIVGGATVMLAPVIIYFVALRLEKDVFVAAMGAIALSAMIPLFIGLATSGVLGQHEIALSAFAFLPAAIGMAIGVWLRGRISQRSFQAVLSVALLGIGFNLIVRGLSD
jgi:uncharacterized membrane protein YfcA